MTDGSQQAPGAPDQPEQAGFPPGTPAPGAPAPSGEPEPAPGAPTPPPGAPLSDAPLSDAPAPPPGAPGAPAPGAPAPGAPQPAPGAPDLGVPAPGAPGEPAPGAPGPPPGAPVAPAGSQAAAQSSAPPKGDLPPGSPLLDSGEPEKKKRKIWPWILGIFLFLILLAGGCGLLLFRAALGPVDEANEFLTSVRDGRTTEAIDSIAPVCRPGDPAAVGAELDALGITDFSMGSPTINSTNGESTGSSSGSVTTSSGSVPARIEVRRIDGDWRVCEFQVGPVSSP